MKALILLSIVFVTGCTSAPPRQQDNICAIFEQKTDWYDDAARARKHWGSPIPVMMAMMHQESRFVAKARPPRKKIFGFIPGPRPSDAYGYSQAKKSTWREYQHDAGNYGADRDDFGDAIDFVGWYNRQSHRRNRIALTDTFRLYLAYHEGQGGYSRGSYRRKGWLQSVARKVARRADMYSTQLVGCEKKLQKKRGFFHWF